MAGKTQALWGWHQINHDWSFDLRPCVHFVGFKDDRYWNAVKVFGYPDFIHPGWDIRALRDIAPCDTVVFATGSDADAPRTKSFNDYNETEN